MLFINVILFCILHLKLNFFNQRWVFGAHQFFSASSWYSEREKLKRNMGAVCWSPWGSLKGMRALQRLGRLHMHQDLCLWVQIQVLQVWSVLSNFPFFRVLSWTILWRSHPTTTSLLGLEDFCRLVNSIGVGAGNMGLQKLSDRPWGEMKGALHWTEICATDMIFQRIGGCFTTWDGYSSWVTFIELFITVTYIGHACRELERQLWGHSFLQYTLSLLKKTIWFLSATILITLQMWFIWQNYSSPCYDQNTVLGIWEVSVETGHFEKNLTLVFIMLRGERDNKQ